MRSSFFAFFFAVVMTGSPTVASAQADASPTTVVDSAPANDSDAAPTLATDAEVATDGGASAEVSETASEEPKSHGKTGLQNLSEALMEILTPVFGLLATGLAGMLLMWMRKKFKLQISDQSIDAWSKLAGKGANRGAEWARNKLKDATEGEKIPGPEVLEVATNWAVATGRDLGLPAMGREKLEGWIESHLFESRDDSL